MNRYRKVLGVSATSVLLATAAYAGGVGIYADAQGSSCTLMDAVPGLHEVHIIYNGQDAILAIEFQIVQTQGAELTYVSEQGTLPTWSRSGRAPDGITFTFGGCYEAPLRVLTVYYSGLGASDICGRLELRNSPLSAYPPNPGFIATFRCGDTGPTWVSADDAVINPDDECNCASGAPTPTAESTWGGIKALYD